MKVVTNVLLGVAILAFLSFAAASCDNGTTNNPSPTDGDTDKVDTADGDEAEQVSELEEAVEEETEDPAIIHGFITADGENLAKVVKVWLFDSYPHQNSTPVAEYVPSGADIDLEQNRIHFYFHGLDAGSYWLAAFVDSNANGSPNLWDEVKIHPYPIEVSPNDETNYKKQITFKLLGEDGLASIQASITLPPQFDTLTARLLTFPADPQPNPNDLPYPYTSSEVDLSATPAGAKDDPPSTTATAQTPALPEGCWFISLWVDLCSDGISADDLFVTWEQCIDVTEQSEEPLAGPEWSLTETDLECTVQEPETDGDEIDTEDAPDTEDIEIDGDQPDGEEIDEEEIDQEDVPTDGDEEVDGDTEDGEFTGPGLLRGTVYTASEFAGRTFVLALYYDNPLESDQILPTPVETFQIGSPTQGSDSFSYEVAGIPVGTFFVRVYVDRLGDGIDETDPFDTLDSGSVEILQPANPWDESVVEGIDFHVFGVFEGTVSTSQQQAGHNLFLEVFNGDPQNGFSAPDTYAIGSAADEPVHFLIEQVVSGDFWIRARIDVNDNGYDESDPFVEWIGNPVLVRFPQAAMWRGIAIDFDQTTCEDGTRICRGTNVLVCRNGSWETFQQCETGACINGTCQICATGSFSCRADVLYSCSGDRWDEVENCFIQGKVCNAESGMCQDCTDGATECWGNSIRQCVGGTWQVGDNCEDSGQICQFGECTTGEGLDGLWDLRGTWTADGTCQSPAAGSMYKSIVQIDQTGTTFTMTSVDDNPINISGTITNEQMTGTGNTNFDMHEDGIDCILGIDQTFEGEIFPDGTIGGTLTMNITKTGTQCEVLDTSPEFPYYIPCSAVLSFKGMRYQCTPHGTEICSNETDDDCDGVIDEEECNQMCTTPGQTMCDQEVLYQCTNDGYWQQVQDCGANDQICDWGNGVFECLDRCTNAQNPPFCDGNVPVVCNEQTGRMERGTDCSELGQICQSGACSDLSDTCNEEGRTICHPDGTKVIRCSSGLWIDAEDCAAQDEVCEDAQCLPRIFSVYQLQNPTDPAHPAENTKVRLQRLLVTSNPVVLSHSSGLTGVFAQEEAGGDFAGIMLALSGDNLPSVAAGDIVNVQGTYVEFPSGNTYTLSEVMVESLEVVEHGQPLPDPVVVDDPADIATGGSRTNALESQLVELGLPVSVIDDSLGFGEWLVTGNLRIDDLIFQYTPPNVGDTLTTLRGFLFVSYNNYKLEPRSEQDIVVGCIDGERRCNDDGDAMICRNGQFELAEQCPFECENGFCILCYTGDVSCEGNHLYQCNEDNQWVDVQNCQLEGTTCNKETESCTPCTDGEYMCRGTVKYVCTSSGTWQEVEDCADLGRTCNLGQCEQGETYDGLWMMQGEVAQANSCSNMPAGLPVSLVVNIDQTGSEFVITSPAAEWLEIHGTIDSMSGTLVGNSEQDATISEGCTEHLVHTLSATPQEDGSLLGSWTMDITEISCPDGAHEFPGPAPCTFATTVRLSRYLCNYVGEEICDNGIDDDCDGETDEEECSQGCQPGTKACNGELLQQCDGSGHWNTLEDCEASGKQCNEATYTCETPCTAGEAECRGNELWTCQANGFFGLAQDCSAESKACDAASQSCIGAGDPCSQEGYKACIGNDVYECSGGSFMLLEQCTGGNVCENGACLNPNACSIDADCADGEICHTGVAGGTCGPACADSEDCVIQFGTQYGYCDPYNEGHCEQRDPISCTSDLSCISVMGWVCHDQIDGGTCAAECTKNAFCQAFDSSLVCGDGGKCEPGTGCWRDEQCADGEVCHTAIDDGVCKPACSSNEDCQGWFGGGYECDTDTGYCEPFTPDECCGPWRNPQPDDLLINEVLADPPPGSEGDANNDGTRDGVEDEFIEIVNVSTNVLNLAGVTVSDGVQVRFTFPEGTFIKCGQAAVVFGGGNPTGVFGYSLVFTSSSGLGLNNSGDTITIKAADGTVITSMTYGSNAGDNQSVVLYPELDPSGSYLKHTQLSGLKFSPGTYANGQFFSEKTSCGYDACVGDSDCPSGFVCHPNADDNGACGSNCTTDADCSIFGSGLVCNSGLCEPVPEGCQNDSDCDAPKVCHADASENGTCANACTSDADCTTLIGPGLECNMDTFRCVHKTSCQNDSDCYAGEVCNTDNMGGLCSQPCTDDTFCDSLYSGLVCDTASGHCQWPTASSCTDDSFCTNGEVCHTAVDGGTCWRTCTSDDDCFYRFGDDRLMCADGYCQTNEHPACTEDADCYDGQVCHTEVLGGRCYEGCNLDSDCKAMFGDEYICDNLSGRCMVNTAYSCSQDADCAEFNICQTNIGNFCWYPCTTDPQCQRFDNMYACDTNTGLCYEREFIPCSSDSDCRDFGSQICHTEVNGGVCGIECNDSNDCYTVTHGAGYVCQTDASQPNYKQCIPACNTDADCANGEVCHTEVAGGTCAQACSGHSFCMNEMGSEYLCDYDSGKCVLNADYSCSSNDDCASFNRCHVDAGNECLPPCYTNDDCHAWLGNAYVCNTESQLCEIDTSYSCTQDADCGADAVCQPINNSCTQPCANDFDCESIDHYAVCDANTGLCYLRTCESDDDCTQYGENLLCHIQVNGGICDYMCSSDLDCELMTGTQDFYCDNSSDDPNVDPSHTCKPKN